MMSKGDGRPLLGNAPSHTRSVWLWNVPPRTQQGQGVPCKKQLSPASTGGWRNVEPPPALSRQTLRTRPAG